MPGRQLGQTTGSGHRRSLTGLTGPIPPTLRLALIHGPESAPNLKVGGGLPARGNGQNLPMDARDGLWQEAAAAVQSSLDRDLRDEAYEVFVAEAARCRLVDRVGRVRVSLRCGVTVAGVLEPGSVDAIDGHLPVRQTDGGGLHVPVSAILAVTGSRPTLRVEDARSPQSLSSWLRECWSAGQPIRLIDGSGRWVAGRLDYVGADHVEIASSADRTVVPLLCVEAWQRG